MINQSLSRLDYCIGNVMKICWRSDRQLSRFRQILNQPVPQRGNKQKQNLFLNKETNKSRTVLNKQTNDKSLILASDQSNDFGMFKVIRKAMDVTEELSIVSGYKKWMYRWKKCRIRSLSTPLRIVTENQAFFFFGRNCIEVRPS